MQKARKTLQKLNFPAPLYSAYPYRFCTFVWIHITVCYKLPRWLRGKEYACQCRRCRIDPWYQRSPGERNGNLLQNYCLGNPMDRGVSWAAVHGVTKSQTWRKQLSMYAWLDLIERDCDCWHNKWQRPELRLCLWKCRGDHVQGIFEEQIVMVSPVRVIWWWRSLGLLVSARMGIMVPKA